jgi:macrolide transport system ATP-binding/permease protein
MILSLGHIAKSFGPTLVLADVSLTVNEGDRLALVGPNGAGKSTLLKIIAGHLEPDGGELVVPRPLDLGYLPQSVEAPPDTSIQRLVLESQERLHHIGARLHELEALLSGGVSPSTPAEARDRDAHMQEHADLTDEYARLGGYTLEHRIEEVFAGLGIRHLDRTRKVVSLSGGEKARVALAALLVRDPDLLLLDEPTNHLDFGALDWLEGFLRRRRVSARRSMGGQCWTAWI